MVGVVGSSPIAPTNCKDRHRRCRFCFGSRMPEIRLPDGSVKSFPRPVTIAEIAASIGAGLARTALAGRVDGKLVDTSHRVETDSEVAIITERDKEGVEI